MPDTANPSNDPNHPNNKKKSSSNADHPAIDVKDPDAVQKGIIDFWGWVEHNSKVVVALVAVAFLAAIAYVIFNSFKSYQERSAQKDYYAAELKYTKLREGYDRAKFKAMMPPGAAAAEDKTKTPDAPASGDVTKDYGAALSDLEKVARDHAGTSAGAQAAILAGETYLEYKQADKAAEVLQLPVKALSDKHLLANLAKMAYGSALATKGDCQAAVGVWQQVLDKKSAVFLHADAGLRSGLCFEQMNQPDKAAEMYRKVTAEAADSAASTTAKGLLRAIELGKSRPAPAAKQG